MNKTQNYQLNQWEKTDKVLMKDFNADNQKIDAALCGMERRLPLKEYVVSEDIASVDIQLDDIDLSRYERIVIRMEISCDSHLRIQVNGLGGTYQYFSTGSYSSPLESKNLYCPVGGTQGHCTLELFPHWNNDYLCWMGSGYSTSGGAVTGGHTDQVSFSQMQYLHFFTFSETGLIRAGSRFRFYGVPKW